MKQAEHSTAEHSTAQPLLSLAPDKKLASVNNSIAELKAVFDVSAAFLPILPPYITHDLLVSLSLTKTTTVLDLNS